MPGWGGGGADAPCPGSCRLHCGTTKIKEYDVRSGAIVSMLDQLISEPCYDTLRTKEQLGYTVHCGQRLTHGVLGFCVVRAAPPACIVPRGARSSAAQWAHWPVGNAAPTRRALRTLRAACQVIISDTHSAAELDARIESFLDSFAAKLKVQTRRNASMHRSPPTCRR